MRRDFLLKCQGVEKKFGALVAVNKLGFDVKVGQVLGIGGSNGAGKTVLFDAISGINPCSSGEITFNGTRIDAYQPDKICHLGISRTFQLNSGFDTLTVAENIRTSRYFGRSRRKVPSFRFDRDTNESVDEILEFVDLQDFADVQVKNLPIFQRKLLMIGSALATDPKLLLLDEPVGGLIPVEIEKIIALVDQISNTKQITIILIEHVMRFLMQLCDSVMILHRGKKLFEGLPNEILTNEKVVEIYLGESAARMLRRNEN
ncbi:ATP-binding cassette domain-containing protein [Rhodobacteraceae bacterium Araon29]